MGGTPRLAEAQIAAYLDGLARFGQCFHGTCTCGAGFRQVAQNSEPHGASGIDRANSFGWIERGRGGRCGELSELAVGSGCGCTWRDRGLLRRLPGKKTPGESAWERGFRRSDTGGCHRDWWFAVGGFAILGAAIRSRRASRSTGELMQL